VGSTTTKVIKTKKRCTSKCCKNKFNFNENKKFDKLVYLFFDIIKVFRKRFVELTQAVES
jgi:hypothetical protein